MNARRLEEVFEECVTAYLEGRRSVQESLQLYPAFAAELAPLLRTAVQLNESFSKVEPPLHVQERVRQRFLSDARARRQVRSLTGSRRAGFFAGLWQQHRLGFASAAAAVAVLVVAVGSAAMLSGGGGSAGGPKSVINATTAPTQRATPARVTNITNKATTIGNQTASGANVKPSDIEELVAAATDLRNATGPEINEARAEVEQALRQADAVLSQVVITQPGVAPQAQQAQDTLRGIAADIGFDLTATATPVPTPTPVNTGETPTPVPTQAPTPQPTAAPTPEPTPAPTNAATETPVERGLPGENP